MSERSHPSERMRIWLLIALAASGCQMAPAAKPASGAAPITSATSPKVGRTRAESSLARATPGPFDSRPTTRAYGAVEAPPQEPGAQTVPMSVPEWHFAASAYFWAPSKRGVIEASGIGIPLDDPDEGTGLFLYLEGERGRWGFVVDLDVLNTTDDADGLGGTIEIDEDTVIVEVDVTFRPDEDSTLQFLAGVRVFDVSQEIRFPILPDLEEDNTQVDPVFGAQGTWSLGNGFNFRLRGDIGGFGVDSDFTYQALGQFGWEFARRWQVTAGYRVLGWEFEVDDIRSDLRLSGVLFGVALSF